jgi:hypothetical protein
MLKALPFGAAERIIVSASNRTGSHHDAWHRFGTNGLRAKEGIPMRLTFSSIFMVIVLLCAVSSCSGMTEGGEAPTEYAEELIEPTVPPTAAPTPIPPTETAVPAKPTPTLASGEIFAACAEDIAGTWSMVVSGVAWFIRYNLDGTYQLDTSPSKLDNDPTIEGTFSFDGVTLKMTDNVCAADRYEMRIRRPEGGLASAKIYVLKACGERGFTSDILTMSEMP